MNEIHDFRLRYWGHDYTIMKVIDGGKELRVSGWKSGIKEGDYLALQNSNNEHGFSRYQVKHINYCANPPDQFFASLTFIQFQTTEELEAFRKDMEPDDV